mmetsp:Transcript_35437/g.80421  ORF Transcript_35437/g.80421 Transcript_35437/m.80421 type:complete len:80 (+) Transcript_35437:62-301(+)
MLSGRDGTTNSESKEAYTKRMDEYVASQQVLASGMMSVEQATQEIADYIRQHQADDPMKEDKRTWAVAKKGSGSSCQIS